MTKTREHVVPSTVFLPHTRGRSGEWGKARRNLEVPLKALHTFRERERLEVRVAVHHVSFFHLLLCFAFSFSFLSHRPPPLLPILIIHTSFLSEFVLFFVF